MLAYLMSAAGCHCFDLPLFCMEFLFLFHCDTQNFDFFTHQSFFSLGDNLLDNVLNMQECLNMDMVWDVVDWYKQAIILTRENDVEMEAIALSRLGRVYDKILKMKSKASECFKRAIQLAMSLHPRTFDSEGKFNFYCIYIRYIYLV